MKRGLSPRTLAAIWVGSLCLSAADSSFSASLGQPPEVFLPIGIATAVYATSGYLMARRRPDNRIGYLLIVVGLAEAGLVALRNLVVWTEVVQVALGPIGPIVMAFVLLAFPSGVLAGRLERVTIGLTAATFTLLSVATLLTEDPSVNPTARCPPCEPNPFRLTDLSVYPIVDSVKTAAILLSALAITVLCARRWWLAHGAGRRLMAPVLFGGIVTSAGYFAIGAMVIAGAAVALRIQFLLTLQIPVPIGLAATFLLVYTARSAVSGAVVQLGANPKIEALEDALRRALHDPALVVARWSAASGAYLDREGARHDVDAPPPGRSVLRLERDGQRVAAVVHDASLAVDPELVQSVAGAVRFAVDTAELGDQLRARGGDVANLPRGEVAFLFGDLEASTELLSALGDEYIDVLAELRQSVREVTDRHHGRVVDARADECFLVFADPADALLAAVELQRRLGEATWPAGSQPRMRMGLHLGQPELTADGYVGIDVHRAARVMDTAHGGEVLASGALASVMTGRLPTGLTLVSLGYQALKGIAEPELLYRVAGTE